jgi:hypothetical protein
MVSQYFEKRKREEEIGRCWKRASAVGTGERKVNRQNGKEERKKGGWKWNRSRFGSSSVLELTRSIPDENESSLVVESRRNRS